MNFKLDLFKLAAARIMLQKQAGLMDGAGVPGSNKMPSPLPTMPAPKPYTTAKSLESKLDKPAPQANLSATISQPNNNFMDGIQNTFGNQKPEGIAGMLGMPLIGDLAKSFLGMTGGAGLGFLTSFLGKDQGRNWNALTHGENGLFKKESGFTDINSLDKVDTPLNSSESLILNAPKTTNHQIETLSKLPAYLAADKAMHYGFDKALFNPATRKVAPNFFKNIPTEVAVSNVLSKAAPELNAATKLPGIGKLLRAPLGPATVPINMAFEGYDIYNNGYNPTGPEYRQSVSVDNTLNPLGLHEFETGAAPSYLGAAFNAWANPIRSTDLLARDTKHFFTGDEKLDALRDIYNKTFELNNNYLQSAAKRIADYEQKARAAGGEHRLTPGEQTDLTKWRNDLNR